MLFFIIYYLYQSDELSWLKWKFHINEQTFLLGLGLLTLSSSHPPFTPYSLTRVFPAPRWYPANLVGGKSLWPRQTEASPYVSPLWKLALRLLARSAIGQNSSRALMIKSTLRLAVSVEWRNNTGSSLKICTYYITLLWWAISRSTSITQQIKQYSAPHQW